MRLIPWFFFYFVEGEKMNVVALLLATEFHGQKKEDFWPTSMGWEEFSGLQLVLIN